MLEEVPPSAKSSACTNPCLCAIPSLFVCRSIAEAEITIRLCCAFAARCASVRLQWRMGRSWAGRVQKRHWELLMQGSKVRPAPLASKPKSQPDDFLADTKCLTD